MQAIWVMIKQVYFLKKDKETKRRQQGVNLMNGYNSV